MTEELQHEGEEQPHLLLVDDDPTFTRVMARAMSRRGLHVSIAGSAEEGLEMAKQELPDYAVLDLKMDGDSGLVLLPKLLELDPEMKVLILTGYSSIATAVEAIKLGEHDGNISATARALGMHRRTLQRKLQKRPVRR